MLSVSLVFTDITFVFIFQICSPHSGRSLYLKLSLLFLLLLLLLLVVVVVVIVVVVQISNIPVMC